MPADGDCIEDNSPLQLLVAQHHFTIKQLPLQLGHKIVVEAFDVVPGPLQPLTFGPGWISIVNDSVSLSKTRHSDCLMLIDSKSAVSKPYIWSTANNAVLLAYQDFHLLWIVRANLALSVTPTCIHLTGTHWVCPLQLSHTMTACAFGHWDISKCSETECSLLSTECLSWALEDEYESWPLVIVHYSLALILHCAPFTVTRWFEREIWCVQRMCAVLHAQRAVHGRLFCVCLWDLFIQGKKGKKT